jgi:hypothetical protein
MNKLLKLFLAINSISHYPYQSYARQRPSDWSNVNSGSRNTYQYRSNTNESNW